MTRRTLGLDNLVSIPEIAAELRCSPDRVRGIVSGLPAVRLGRVTLYRWRDVLAVVVPEQVQRARLRQVEGL